MSADIAQKSVAISNEKLVNQNYATLFLSWISFNHHGIFSKCTPLGSKCFYLPGQMNFKEFI